MTLVALHPRDAGRAIARSGSVARALWFATISFVAHASMITCLLLLVGWLHAAEAQARFGIENPVGSLALARIGEGIVATWLMGPIAVMLSIVVVATLLPDASLSITHYVRAHAYACAIFVPATIPLVGLLAYFVFPTFLYHWLAARTSLPPARRGFAISTATLTGWAIAGTIVDEILGALDMIPYEIVWDLLN